MAITTEEKSAALASLPLFAGISDESLRRLAEVAGEQEFSAGEFIVRQGQAGTGLYVLLEGEVVVVRGTAELARLQPPEFLGELAVIDQQPRGASARATVPTRCLAIASWDLLKLLQQDPALSLNMIKALVARLRSAGDSIRH
jgi:CRP-like cAMP-binding protein